MTTGKNNAAPDPQPAELAEQQRAALPGPLEELRDAAQHALDCADGGDDYACGRPMIEALTTLGIMEKTGRGLWSTNVQIARSVVDALAATGKQQVGEVQGDALTALVAKWRAQAATHEVNGLEADSIGLTTAAMRNDARAHVLEEAANELQAALAARQPVRIYGCCAQPEGELHTTQCPNMRHLAARQPGAQVPRAWLIHWSHIPLESTEVTTSASRVDAVNALTDPPRIEPLYAAPPAQGIDLGVTEEECEWIDYAIAHMRDDSEPEDLTCADALEQLLRRIDGPRDAAPGVGNG